MVHCSPVDTTVEKSSATTWAVCEKRENRRCSKFNQRGEDVFVQGVCSVIMGVAPEQLTLDHTAESSKRWQFPPTLFVHMARDKTTAAWIKEDMKALQQQVPACTAAPLCLPRCLQAPSCLCSEPVHMHKSHAMGLVD